MEKEEDAAAARLLHSLRRHRSEEEILRALPALRAQFGYTAFGAFLDGSLIAVAGGRILETLARGRHFHIDDLVVAEEHRGRGVGAIFLAEVEREVAGMGLPRVFLDSRQEAVEFYERIGYERHPSIVFRSPRAAGRE